MVKTGWQKPPGKNWLKLKYACISCVNDSVLSQLMCTVAIHPFTSNHNDWIMFNPHRACIPLNTRMAGERYIVPPHDLSSNLGYAKEIFRNHLLHEETRSTIFLGHISQGQARSKWRRCQLLLVHETQLMGSLTIYMQTHTVEVVSPLLFPASIKAREKDPQDVAHFWFVPLKDIFSGFNSSSSYGTCLNLSENLLNLSRPAFSFVSDERFRHVLYEEELLKPEKCL